VITDFQKQIYNSHLAISRKIRDKPFRIRKDFSDLDKNKLDILASLERFFNSYSNIKIDEYFTAPYVIFEDDDYFDLDFFLSSKAKKAYSQYMKKIEIDDPDSEGSLKRLADSLKFIKNFCKEKSLTLENYPVYIESNLPCIVEHLKNHKINMYTLHALGVSKIEVENRILDFIFSDFWITFQKTKNKFYLSKKMKEFAKQATIKIKQQNKTKQ
jgi:hypothetical protein